MVYTENTCWEFAWLPGHVDTSVHHAAVYVTFTYALPTLYGLRNPFLLVLPHSWKLGKNVDAWKLIVNFSKTVQLYILINFFLFQLDKDVKQIEADEIWWRHSNHIFQSFLRPLLRTFLRRPVNFTLYYSIIYVFT